MRKLFVEFHHGSSGDIKFDTATLVVDDDVIITKKEVRTIEQFLEMSSNITEVVVYDTEFMGSC